MGVKRASASRILRNISMLTILFQQILFVVTYFCFRSLVVMPLFKFYNLSREYLERYFDAPKPSYFEHNVEIMKCVLEPEKLFVFILIICIIRLLVIIFSSRRKRTQALVGLAITLAVIGVIIWHGIFTEDLYYLYMRLLPGEVLSLFCAYLLRLQRADSSTANA